LVVREQYRAVVKLVYLIVLGHCSGAAGDTVGMVMRLWP